MKAKDPFKANEIPKGIRVSLFRRSALIRLEIPGIFFVAASENLDYGRKTFDRFNRKLAGFEALRKRVAEAQTKLRKLRQGRHKAARESQRVEDLEVDLLQGLRKLEILYEPVFRSFAAAFILLVASAEAFINEVAESELAGRRRQDEFDRLSAVGKWLFLPRILGLRKKFSPDREPLQGFAEAVRYRNKLIHHKPRSCLLAEFDLLEVLRDFGLTAKEVERGLRSVQSLIREFSLAWKGSFGPDWLYPDTETFRRPCLFIGNRKYNMVLASEEIDGPGR